MTNDNFGTQGIQVHSSLTPTPEEFGIRQSCTVSVPWSNEYFYYAIVAIDNSQNRGKVSNLVSVLIKETPSSTTKLADAWEDDALVNNLTSSRSASKDDNMFNAGANWFRGLSQIELYFILSGGAAFLILLSIFIIVLVCLKRKKSKTGEAPPAYHNIYSQGNGGGKGQPGSQPPKDGIGCCWENDSNSAEPKHITVVTPQKINGLSSPYITDTKSYIPASALCAPLQHGSIYRDMYAGSGSTQHTHDSSSVDSKPSDGGSNETVHVSDGHHTPASLTFYTPTHMPPPTPRALGSGSGSGGGVSNMIMNLNFESQHNLHNQSHNNLSRDPLPVMREQFYPSTDDDEGGFKAQRRNLDGFHKIVPMPSSDYDSPSMMNGSTYGGSVMSIPSSNKKRTRHISFV